MLERLVGFGVYLVVRGVEVCEDTVVGGGEVKVVRG